MKNKILLFLLLIFSAINGSYGCLILDPTYDFTFKALFGENGPDVEVPTGHKTKQKITAKQRLISFLNSLLNMNPFNIKIRDLEYLNTDTTNTLGDRLIFDVRCKCSKEKNGITVDYNIDIEMQKASQEGYFTRITNYSARLLDINQKQDSKNRQKVIVISILDCILPNCENDVAFLVAPFKQTLYGVNDENDMFTLADDTMFHLGIQLPLFVQKLGTGTGEIYTNKWLPFLGSRRMAENNGTPIKKGRYDSDYASQVKGPELKSAVKLMQNYATNTTSSEEEMILKEEQKVDLLAEKERLIAEKDGKIKEQEQALQNLNQNLNQEKLKNILVRDIKKYKKATNDNPTKPKKLEQKYKFAKRLKGLEINELKGLLSENQWRSKAAKAYFKAIGAAKVCFDENSMEEEEL